MRSMGIRFALAPLILALLVVPALAQRPAANAPAAHERHEDEGFKNLKVLPKDISHDELQAVMAGFTRALGVRCDFCHVRQGPGQPMRHEDFQLDDKPTKATAREMIAMVRDINGKYLAALAHREDPPIKVECVTCHHGTPEPRTLQSILRASYDQGGLDSTRARYDRLRDRYYGRAAYDFSEVPLADVGMDLAKAGHPADAESLLSLNVTMNPTAPFARRQWATFVIGNGFRKGAAEGAQAVAAVRARNGAQAANEGLVNEVVYRLLGEHDTAAALAAAQFNVGEHPESSNVFDALGDVYMTAADRKRARDAYAKAIVLDAKNDDARRKLEELKHPAKK